MKDGVLRIDWSLSSIEIRDLFDSHFSADGMITITLKEFFDKINTLRLLVNK